MATERDIVESCLQFLDPDKQGPSRQLVTQLTQRVVKTVAGYNQGHWTWLEESYDCTADATNPVHTMPREWRLISEDGAWPLDASGDPNGLPLVYQTEKGYHQLRAANDTSTGERYYIVLKELADGKLLQVRFWPNIENTTRVWGFRYPASTDIVYISNELMLVKGVLGILPSRLFAEAARYNQGFVEDLARENRADRQAAADRITWEASARTKAHRRAMRKIQT